MPPSYYKSIITNISIYFLLLTSFFVAQELSGESMHHYLTNSPGEDVSPSALWVVPVNAIIAIFILVKMHSLLYKISAIEDLFRIFIFMFFFSAVSLLPALAMSDPLISLKGLLFLHFLGWVINWGKKELWLLPQLPFFAIFIVSMSTALDSDMGVLISVNDLLFDTMMVMPAAISFFILGIYGVVVFIKKHRFVSEPIILACAILSLSWFFEKPSFMEQSVLLLVVLFPLVELGLFAAKKELCRNFIPAAIIAGAIAAALLLTRVYPVCYNLYLDIDDHHKTEMGPKSSAKR